MTRLKRIFWLGLKEIVSLSRDTVMLGLLVYSFTLGLIMEATGTSTTVNNASIAFVDEDGSALSRMLAASFLPPEFQEVVQIQAAEAGPAMDSDRFLFVVAVPPGFEADVLAAMRTFQAPTLIITGANETQTRKDHAALLDQRLAHCREIVLHESGHLSNLTEPERYNEAVLTFCLDVEATR